MVISENGRTHLFRVYLPEARGVELVGTFSGWCAQAIPMRREGAGWWVARADLNAGDHDFSYLVNGSAWLADYAASGVRRNGYGGWVSQIHVPATVVVRQAAAMAA